LIIISSRFVIAVHCKPSLLLPQERHKVKAMLSAQGGMQKCKIAFSVRWAYKIIIEDSK
jgi:hypothetical protein